jgi:hypothetical protein
MFSETDFQMAMHRNHEMVACMNYKAHVFVVE